MLRFWGYPVLPLIVAFTLCGGRAGAVRCYACNTHYDVIGDPNNLSSYVLQDFDEQSNSQSQCIIRPQDADINECEAGCVVMGGKGQLLRPLPGSGLSGGGQPGQKQRSSGWDHIRSVSGVWRLCAEDLPKRTAALRVPEMSTCEHQEGNILGIQAHFVVCSCDGDLCNNRTDVFKKLDETSCIVHHVPEDKASEELNTQVFHETTALDRQSCVRRCALEETCKSVKILQTENQDGISCAMSSYETPCSDELPKEFSGDIEPKGTGPYWLSCLSDGCKDHKTTNTFKSIPKPSDCRFTTIDHFPTFCHNMRHEMKDRRFCLLRRFRKACRRTCCDF